MAASRLSIGTSTSGTGGTSLLEVWGTGMSGWDYEKLWCQDGERGPRRKEEQKFWGP